MDGGDMKTEWKRKQEYKREIWLIDLTIGADKQQKEFYTYLLSSDQLGIRTLNCIFNNFKDTTDWTLKDLSLQSIANMGSKELLKRKNFGKKSVAHLGKALQHVGVIKSTRSWLSPKNEGGCCPHCGKLL